MRADRGCQQGGDPDWLSALQIPAFAPPSSGSGPCWSLDGPHLTGSVGEFLMTIAPDLAFHLTLFPSHYLYAPKQVL